MGLWSRIKNFFRPDIEVVVYEAEENSGKKDTLQVPDAPMVYKTEENGNEGNAGICINTGKTHELIPEDAAGYTADCATRMTDEYRQWLEQQKNSTIENITADE